MESNDAFNEFQKFLKETDGDLHILEKQVPVEMQMEYFKYSNELRKKGITLENDDFDQLDGELYNAETTIASKKKILSRLAASKQVRAYRVLEKYAQSPEEELIKWAYMALMESRISLESELSDEKQIYISTGLGGKGQKLRFFVLLLSVLETPFLDYQKQVIERELEYVFASEDCEIERLQIEEHFVEMVILAPIRKDLKLILKNIIGECNQYGGFLSEFFTVTNVKELTKEEIRKVLNKHGNNQAGS